MIRLVGPLAVLTIVLFAIAFVLHGQRRRKVLHIARNLVIAFASAGAVLLAISFVFYLTGMIK